MEEIEIRLDQKIHYLIIQAPFHATSPPTHLPALCPQHGSLLLPLHCALFSLSLSPSVFPVVFFLLFFLPPFLFPPPLPRPFSATPSKSSALVQLVFVVSFTLKTAGPSIRLVHACTCLPRTSKRRKSRGGSLPCRVTHSTKRGRKMALALHCPQQQTALERSKQKNIFIGIEGWRNDQTRMSMSMTLWTRSPTLTKIFLQTQNSYTKGEERKTG